MGMTIAEVDWMVGDEQRATIQPMLAHAWKALPPWVEALSVRYDPDEANLASINVLPEYRTAHIRIGNAWFSDTAAERQASITHEVTHAHIEPLAKVYDALLEACTEADSPLRKWAEEQWRKVEEGVVSDLSRVLVRG